MRKDKSGTYRRCFNTLLLFSTSLNDSQESTAAVVRSRPATAFENRPDNQSHMRSWLELSEYFTKQNIWRMCYLCFNLIQTANSKTPPNRTPVSCLTTENETRTKHTNVQLLLLIDDVTHSHILSTSSPHGTSATYVTILSLPYLDDGAGLAQAV
jgi:hypothetical protein